MGIGGPLALFVASLCLSYIFFSFQGWGKVNSAKQTTESLTARLTSARDSVDALERESSGFLTWLSRRDEAQDEASETEKENQQYARAATDESEGA